MFDSIKFDCKHFKGLIPCKPNKEKDCVCDSCEDYIPITKRILIIKLGALGDVIRSTPLVVKYREMYPNCHITWVTQFPDVLPPQDIDEIYKLDALTIYKVQNTKFDIAINLDKEIEAIALLKDVEAEEKYGYILKNNHLDAATPAAQHKIITGLYDNISKENTKSYLEEIFEICHLEFNKEPYLLNYNKTFVEKWSSLKEKSKGKKIIGLNTGCGPRWKTRLWPEKHWIKFINLLIENDYFPLILGGPGEDEINTYYAKETGAYYPGTFSLEEFIGITANCDLVVTQVSMMMHIATGLQKPLILFNNIFNKHEFELYDRGVIIEPSSGCDCFYGLTCKRDVNCMNDILPDTVINALIELKSIL